MLQYCLRTYLFCARKVRKSKLKLFIGVCHSPQISAIHTRRYPPSQTQNPFHGFQQNISDFFFLCHLFPEIPEIEWDDFLSGLHSAMECTKNLAGSVWQRSSLAKK